MTDDELDRALAALARGEVVAAATETFFGFLADPRETGALDRLFELKGRQADKGVALLVPDVASWSSLVTEIPPAAERLAHRFWPGPLTIGLPARAELDRRLTVDGTVAVRWAGSSDAARIATAFGAPLTATSANRSGEPPSVTGNDVERVFGEALASRRLVVVPGVAPGGEPSTVVIVTGEEARVVRPGRVRESELRRALAAS